MDSRPTCKNLVLDAGPLLSLTPLRGLAERYLTVPQVLSELKDKRAREHFEQLGLSAGVQIEVREPDAASLAEVLLFAKKTGDYAVLSHADLCILALTHSLDKFEKDELKKGKAEGATEPRPSVEEKETAEEISNSATPGPDIEEESEEENLEEGEEPLDVTLEQVQESEGSPSRDQPTLSEYAAEGPSQSAPVFEDPDDDEDDGEGEWITPDNVGIYKSKALDLVPSADNSDPFTTVTNKKGRRSRWQNGTGSPEDGKPKEQVLAGCMTADFAMQNVLLQMGLSLVGVEGRKIEKVKTWVLRCHACFKICKDSTKKFCPSCGSPSLLRTTVTASSPTANASTPAMQVHLKKNFVYRTRGTKYSIPSPKPGSSKTGAGTGLILREDQVEFQRAVRREEGRREREERKLLNGAVEAAKAKGALGGGGGVGTGVQIGGWMDPDWIPEMMNVGIGGKGRKAPDPRVPTGADGMPIIGYGRKNPNERRRKK